MFLALLSSFLHLCIVVFSPILEARVDFEATLIFVSITTPFHSLRPHEQELAIHPSSHNHHHPSNLHIDDTTGSIRRREKQSGTGSFSSYDKNKPFDLGLDDNIFLIPSI